MQKAKTYKQLNKRLPDNRPSSAVRGYGARWQRAREQYLRLCPLCVKCMLEGKITPAKVVDHIVPHKGDMVLFWDVNNWQPLCVQHHNSKTAKEDGGFGKKRDIDNGI